MRTHSTHLTEGSEPEDRGAAGRPMAEERTRLIENWIVGGVTLLSLGVIILTTLSDRQAPGAPGDPAAGIERSIR